MNVFVPESAFGDKRTPVYSAVDNSGWRGSHLRASVTVGTPTAARRAPSVPP
jgi:hypothetical protein